jgi:hypothetical protein
MDAFSPKKKEESDEKPITIAEFARRTRAIIDGDYSDFPIVVNRFPNGKIGRSGNEPSLG